MPDMLTMVSIHSPTHCSHQSGKFYDCVKFFTDNETGTHCTVHTDAARARAIEFAFHNADAVLALADAAAEAAE